VATKPLPFLEKDAMRWRDNTALMLTEIKGIIRATMSASVTTRLEAVAWQMEKVVNDIEDTISNRKGGSAR